ncbi:hypothetical protein ACNKHW_17610 [Shigella flexneri]
MDEEHFGQAAAAKPSADPYQYAAHLQKHCERNLGCSSSALVMQNELARAVKKSFSALPRGSMGCDESRY